MRATRYAYKSNLTLEQWELIEPLIALATPGGRRRGCTSRNLPGDFPAWQTVYRYFRTWRKDGTWLRLHNRLRTWVRVASERAAS